MPSASLSSSASASHLAFWSGHTAVAVGGAIVGHGVIAGCKCASAFSVTSTVQLKDWRVSIGHCIHKENAHENSPEHETKQAVI